jgi:hypothetical protein
MNLNEFIGEQSIFRAIGEVEPFPFIVPGEDPFDENGLLDIILKIGYGEREMWAPYITLEMDKVAAVLVKFYRDKWYAYIEMVGIQENVNKRRESTIIITNQENRTINKDDINKVSAFNSPDMLDTDGVSSNTVEGLTGDKRNVVNDTFFDPKNDFILLNDITKDGIIDKIMWDVANSLTLNIY